jgi:hypothetical protein
MCFYFLFKTGSCEVLERHTLKVWGSCDDRPFSSALLGVELLAVTQMLSAPNFSTRSGPELVKCGQIAVETT